MINKQQGIVCNVLHLNETLIITQDIQEKEIVDKIKYHKNKFQDNANDFFELKFDALVIRSMWLQI